MIYLHLLVHIKSVFYILIWDFLQFLREFSFVVKSLDNGKSDITISNNVENPDAAGMAKNLFAMIGQGLKKFYEL